MGKKKKSEGFGNTILGALFIGLLGFIGWLGLSVHQTSIRLAELGIFVRTVHQDAVAASLAALSLKDDLGLSDAELTRAVLLTADSDSAEAFAAKLSGGGFINTGQESLAKEAFRVAYDSVSVSAESIILPLEKHGLDLMERQSGNRTHQTAARLRPSLGTWTPLALAAFVSIALALVIGLSLGAFRRGGG